LLWQTTPNLLPRHSQLVNASQITFSYYTHTKCAFTTLKEKYNYYFVDEKHCNKESINLHYPLELKKGSSPRLIDQVSPNEFREACTQFDTSF